MLAVTGALSIHGAWFELPGLPSCNQQVITRLHNPLYIHCIYVAFSMTAGSIYTNVYTWDCEGYYDGSVVITQGILVACMYWMKDCHVAM